MCFDVAGETIGKSSSCLCIKIPGVLLSVFAMLEIVSPTSSKLAGAVFAPKGEVVSAKNFPSHLNPKYFHSDMWLGIIL